MTRISTSNSPIHLSAFSNQSTAHSAIEPTGPGQDLHPEQLTLSPLSQKPGVPARDVTLLSEKAVRLKIYYGTSDPLAIQAQARQKLGVEVAQLPAPEERTANFETFVERHFPKAPDVEDPFDDNYYGPVQGSPLFDIWEKYAHTDYGALMIQKVLDEAGDSPFAVKVIDDVPPQAWDNFISFPSSFPPQDAHFRWGGQAIDPLAVMHHEFEHTRFGRFANDAEQIMDDEFHAVKDSENPVRVLNGFEPRYTYTQTNPFGEPIQTLNILTGETRPGAHTFEALDPRKLRPVD